MKEAHQDLWHFLNDLKEDRDTTALVITTNGFVKNNGSAMMGCGCAAEAKRRYPGIEYDLGKSITENGNVTSIISNEPVIVAFPVKPESLWIDEDKDFLEILPQYRGQFSRREKVSGWMLKASLSLITKSAIQLVSLADENGWKRIVVPRPGCGAGGLKWEYVCSLISPILDDRFIVVHI